MRPELTGSDSTPAGNDSFFPSDHRSGDPSRPAVPNYLVFAILTTVLCCLPAGIPAIVYAAQVNGKLQAGDIAGAQMASKNAKLWCLISAGVGVALVGFYFLFLMLGVISSMHSN